MLDVQNLCVTYGMITAVKSLSFSLSEGEILALLGLNGSGKTSAVEAIVGLATKRGGTVKLDGIDITSLATDKIVKHGITLVPQWRELFPQFTIEETLIAGRNAAGGRGAGDIATIYELFPRLGERRSQHAGLLSGGEQQMLTIGRALMSNPRFLLLDEPSAGLSVSVVRDVIEAIAKIKKTGVGIVLVEQNLEIANALASECVVLAAGEVSWRGAIADLNKESDLRKAYFEF